MRTMTKTRIRGLRGAHDEKLRPVRTADGTRSQTCAPEASEVGQQNSLGTYFIRNHAEEDNAKPHREAADPEERGL